MKYRILETTLNSGVTTYEVQFFEYEHVCDFIICLIFDIVLAGFGKRLGGAHAVWRPVFYERVTHQEQELPSNIKAVFDSQMRAMVFIDQLLDAKAEAKRKSELNKVKSIKKIKYP